jgi:hypothetical protein
VVDERAERGIGPDLDEAAPGTAVQPSFSASLPNERLAPAAGDCSDAAAVHDFRNMRPPDHGETEPSAATERTRQ